MSDSWTSDLLVGLAEYLAANAGVLWEPTATYSPTSTQAVTTMRNLPDKPDRAIALTLYGDTDTDEAELNDTTALVQVRVRGTADPRVCDAITDAVFNALHGARMVVLGTAPNQVHTSLIRRRSGALLGPDGNGRYERTENYYVMAARPTTHRPD